MREPPYLSGILIVDKPKGATSHQVVQAVRSLVHQKRVGHGGTLDPLASGVLPMMLGYATRVAEYLLGMKKCYRARVRFGTSTTTYDAEGEVTAVRPAESLTREKVEEALASFRGEIEQLPPMYAALKYRGEPLYQWAREGISLERPSRKVTIYRLDLVEWDKPEVALEVECSRGTYVRALAHDLGEALGCGGYLAGLRRLSCGQFTLEEAHSLAEIEEVAARGAWGEVLAPLDKVLVDLPQMVVEGEAEAKIRQGQKVAGPEFTSPCLAYAADGPFIGILRWAPEGLWQPHKVFPRDLFPPSRRLAGGSH